MERKNKKKGKRENLFWVGGTEAKVSTEAADRAINHTSANGTSR